MKRKSLLLIALVGIIFLASWAPPASQACEFCNLTGFVNCESTTGTACVTGVPNRRCYINPACACEWGFCRCVNGVWSCIW